jgi:hypothetical protein
LAGRKKMPSMAISKRWTHWTFEIAIEGIFLRPAKQRAIYTACFEAASSLRGSYRTGLPPLKKLDCLLVEAGDGGICASVSSVRSDKDHMFQRGRARLLGMMTLYQSHRPKKHAGAVEYAHLYPHWTGREMGIVPGCRH